MLLCYYVIRYTLYVIRLYSMRTPWRWAGAAGAAGAEGAAEAVTRRTIQRIHTIQTIQTILEGVVLTTKRQNLKRPRPQRPLSSHTTQRSLGKPEKHSRLLRLLRLLVLYNLHPKYLKLVHLPILVLVLSVLHHHPVRRSLNRLPLLRALHRLPVRWRRLRGRCYCNSGSGIGEGLRG
jgi:hypothetical protein